MIHDRDPLFTVAFGETLAAAGVQVVTLWVGLELPILALIPGLGNLAWREASDLR